MNAPTPSVHTALSGGIEQGRWLDSKLRWLCGLGDFTKPTSAHRLPLPDAGALPRSFTRSLPRIWFRIPSQHHSTTAYYIASRLTALTFGPPPVVTSDIYLPSSHHPPPSILSQPSMSGLTEQPQPPLYGLSLDVPSQHQTKDLHSLLPCRCYEGGFQSSKA